MPIIFNLPVCINVYFSSRYYTYFYRYINSTHLHNLINKKKKKNSTHGYNYFILKLFDNNINKNCAELR